MPRKNLQNYDLYQQRTKEKREREKARKAKENPFSEISVKVYTRIPAIDTHYDNAQDAFNVLLQMNGKTEQQIWRHLNNLYKKEYGDGCVVVVDSLILRSKGQMKWVVELTCRDAENKKEWLNQAIVDWLGDFHFDYGDCTDIKAMRNYARKTDEDETDTIPNNYWKIRGT